MNNRAILDALLDVKEVGYLTPTSDPPDILGVLFLKYGVEGDLGLTLDRVKEKCELNHRDIDNLLDRSDGTGKAESPKQRRDRLVDFFARELERESL